MSKKFKSQASSARAASTAFGSSTFGFASAEPASSISYIAEQPDLSAVTDSHLVVSLRNLGKKDSTTKAKALEELQEHVRAHGPDVEDAVITAWVRSNLLEMIEPGLTQFTDRIIPTHLHR
jgi:E3 ubiquitin-protein ligase listerin